MPFDEETPLLGDFRNGNDNDPFEHEWDTDPHAQFCALVGVPPSNPGGGPRSDRPAPRKSLYGRATRQLRDQRFTYYATASLSNVLLLSQVVLGAALTALGASASSHVLITLFGATNTIIAGLVAYLKSRGQPMRARMFLNDLEHVVGEIENSEVMWLGITHHALGYDEINTDEHQVTVRSEVARLTRLYDRAVNSNTVNNPDMYMAGQAEGSAATMLKSRSQPGQSAVQAPQLPVISAAVAPVEVAIPPVVAPAPAEDESPATTAPKEESNDEPPKKDDDEDDSSKKDESKGSNGKKAGNDDDADADDDDGNKEKDKSKKKLESTKKSEPATSQQSSSSAKTASASVSSLPPPPPRDPDASPASDPFVPLKQSSSSKESELLNGET